MSRLAEARVLIADLDRIAGDCITRAHRGGAICGAGACGLALDRSTPAVRGEAARAARSRRRRIERDECRDDDDTRDDGTLPEADPGAPNASAFLPSFVLTTRGSAS
jgi:hypothetical protein